MQSKELEFASESPLVSKLRPIDVSQFSCPEWLTAEFKRMQILPRKWIRSHMEIYFFKLFINWDNIDFRNRHQQAAVHVLTAPGPQKCKLVFKEVYWKEGGLAFLLRDLSSSTILFLIICTIKSDFFCVKLKAFRFSRFFWVFLEFLEC